MKNENYKRMIASVLAIAMACSLSACAPKKDADANGVATGSGEGKLFTDSTEISIAVGSHVSWPYDQNWKIWQYFQEETGAKFNVQAIPNTEITTKVNLMMASPETLPDLLHITDKNIVEKHITSGAFISIDDVQDKMPNYTNFIKSLPEETSRELLTQRKSGDGKIYCPPVYGTETVNNLYTWMYRKDIFDKNNLTVPKTMDEVYDTAMKMKKLYPNSYPLCFRNGLERFDVLGPQWKPGFARGLYFDFKNNKWSYGASEDTMKQMVEFFIKMYENKLVPPDYITMETKAWEELMTTDRGFMTTDFIVRLDFFNIPNRKVNPQFTLAVMEPPKASEKGSNNVAKMNIDTTGYMICNTSDKKRIDNATKLLDWMYSDKALEILNWGRENETYKVVNGKKAFILQGEENPRKKYGVGTYGLYQRTDPESNEALYSEEQRKQSQIATTYTETHANPVLWMPLSEENVNKVSEINDALSTHTFEQLSKFLLKQRPISEWDNFVKELEGLRVNELISIYNDAYNNLMK